MHRRFARVCQRIDYISEKSCFTVKKKTFAILIRTLTSGKQTDQKIYSIDYIQHIAGYEKRDCRKTDSLFLYCKIRLASECRACTSRHSTGITDEKNP